MPKAEKKEAKEAKPKKVNTSIVRYDLAAQSTLLGEELHCPWLVMCSYPFPALRNHPPPAVCLVPCHQVAKPKAEKKEKPAKKEKVSRC